MYSSGARRVFIRFRSRPPPHPRSLLALHAGFEGRRDHRGAHEQPHPRDRPAGPAAGFPRGLSCRGAAHPWRRLLLRRGMGDRNEKRAIPVGTGGGAKPYRSAPFCEEVPALPLDRQAQQPFRDCEVRYPAAQGDHAWRTAKNLMQGSRLS